MFAKTYPFPPLASATPRLLFDFSSRFNESLRLRYDQHRTSQSLFFWRPSFRPLVFSLWVPLVNLETIIYDEFEMYEDCIRISPSYQPDAMTATRRRHWKSHDSPLPWAAPCLVLLVINKQTRQFINFQ